MGQEIEAGKAVVRVGVDDSDYNPGLDRAEKRLKAFGAAALSLGAKLGGLGIGLGTGLFGVTKSFASTGVELDAVNQKIAKLGKNSTELEKLQKEAARLSKIMGGEDVQAALKLNDSFQELSDSVNGIVVKFGAVLAPILTDVTEYLTKGAKAVTDFIGRNRALAPQAAMVAGALVAAGAAVGALGAAFFVAGPIIKLSMLAASAATLAFSVVLGGVNAVVSVASAVVKVLAGAATLASMAYRFLAISTVSFSVAQATANIAVRIAAATFGILYSITKAVTLAIALTTLTIGLSAAGFKTLASTIRTARMAMLAFKLTSVAVSAISFTGLIGSGAALAAGFLLWTDTGKQFIEFLSSAFTSLQEGAAAAFSDIIGEGASLSPALTGYFADVVAMASSTFGTVADAAAQAFAAAKEFFWDILATAQTTFQGVSDAIEAGNIQLAMDVLWAGLKVGWVQGTDFLKTTWQTALIWIEGAFDQVGTNLKMIWDVSIAYLEGAFDKFVLYIRNAMQDVSNYIAETLSAIDPTGFLVGDIESIQEEDKAQRELINKGAKEREDERNNTVANAGNDPETQARAADRQARLNKLGQASPELAALQAQLATLVGQAAVEAKQSIKALEDKGKPGTEAAMALGNTMNSAAAQARGSAGAAGSLAKAYNGQAALPEQQLAVTKSQLKITEKQAKFLEQIAKQEAITIVERS